MGYSFDWSQIDEGGPVHVYIRRGMSMEVWLVSDWVGGRVT